MALTFCISYHWFSGCVQVSKGVGLEFNFSTGQVLVFLKSMNMGLVLCDCCTSVTNYLQMFSVYKTLKNWFGVKGGSQDYWNTWHCLVPKFSQVSIQASHNSLLIIH